MADTRSPATSCTSTRHGTSLPDADEDEEVLRDEDADDDAFSSPSSVEDPVVDYRVFESFEGNAAQE